MATIEKLICNLKDEVSKWFYQKGEVDGKLDEKAGTSVASSSGNGLMSSADKVKLDGVATGANKTTVDSALSATSVNPVQNKIVHQELANKSDIDHTHELGGANLIPGTQDMSFPNTGTGFEIDGKYRGLTVLHINNSDNDTYQDGIKFVYSKDKEYGEYYTLSFWLKGTVKTSACASYFYSGVTAQVVKSVDGWTKSYGDGECRFNITSEWRRVWVVYKLNTTGTISTSKVIAIRANAGADIYVAGIKLERGDQPSDWSPAPDDIVSINKVDSALSSTSTNPVQNKVVKAQVDSLNNNKANIEHTHGEAYNATTLRSNTFCQVLGNVAIVSWWSGSVNISQAGDWVDLWTLPVTNKGKVVWTENLHNGVGTVLYFKVEAGSNKVQALSSHMTGSLPHYPGQLVFFID